MLRQKPKWLESLFPWEQKSVVVNGRTMAYIDEGEGPPILLLSGNPTWGFLYRFMVEPLTAAGYRAIAPDWIGAGYSDHPRDDRALTMAHHIADLVSLIDQLDLRDFVVVGQDWGGTLSEAEAAAYGVPFPSAQYQTGLLMFPRLVPCHPQHPGAYDNRVAIETLKSLQLPVFLPWGDQGGGIFAKEEQLRYIFKNVAPPLSIEGGVHFIQEEAGEELAAHIVTWMTA